MTCGILWRIVTDFGKPKGEFMMPSALNWTRSFPKSANNFDLTATNPQDLNAEQIDEALDAITTENHRGLTLSSRAITEFRRWLNQPDTPLKSEAYVLLSNWFTTNSGDRLSKVANRCENLWDVLFSCRPVGRLSSPEAGRNHLVVGSEFHKFWQRLMEVQGEAPLSADKRSDDEKTGVSMMGTQGDRKPDGGDHLHAKFEKDGLHCEVEGSPRAVADFLKRISVWSESPEQRESPGQ
jgi:hypothetical protein